MLQGEPTTFWVYGDHTNILIISLFVNLFYVVTICLCFERERERERD